MITCSNIKKQYDGLQVLKGVSLTIEKGELVCIVGPSGAGKSTLLHILGTLDTPDEGDLLLNGKKITNEVKQRQRNKNYNHRLHRTFKHGSKVERYGGNISIRFSTLSNINRPVFDFPCGSPLSDQTCQPGRNNNHSSQQI